MNCRSKKIKCSGDESRCNECVKTGGECVYVQSRRDRLKIITEQNEVLIELLKDLSARVGEEERDRIMVVLDRVESDC